MKTIYFARHGECQANLDGVLAGARTNSPLTRRGKEQAIEISQIFVEPSFQAIVSSPLERALMTASIIAQEIGFGGEVEKNELFIERDFGAATDLPKPKAFELLDSGRAVGAETITAFGARAQDALEWLRKHDAEVILVVSHAAFGQMLGTLASGGRPEDFLQFHTLSNAGVFKFEV